MDKNNIKCPVDMGLSLIGGKWKMLIIGRIYENNKIRFNELKRVVGNISTQELVRKLNELRQDKLAIKVTKKSQNVEYSLTNFGKSAVPIIIALKEWGYGKKNMISKYANS
jgi:DNA-binding HxlR family transcriptional regulator